MSLQLAMNFKKHIWSSPSEFKDLSGAVLTASGMWIFPMMGVAGRDAAIAY